MLGWYRLYTAYSMATRARLPDYCSKNKTVGWMMSGSESHVRPRSVPEAVLLEAT